MTIMTRPRLCHVLPAFGTGGTEVRTSLIIDASCDAFQHSVVALNGDLGGRSRVASREAVRFLGAPPGCGLGGLSRLLRGLAPDLVLTYGWGGTGALIAASLAGLRRVVHAEDGFLPDEAARQRPRRLLARRILLRLAWRVVCPSRTLVGIATGPWSLPESKVRFIPNGVDTEVFSPGDPSAAAATRRRLGCEDGELLVGSVGRLGAEKNPARLVRAFAALAARRPARLAFVGDGPMRDPLVALAGRLGVADRVAFVGNSDRPEEFYRAMDVFALSSDTEQMPIAVLEAMSMGLPVVGTDVGDVRDMVAPENRPFVTPAGREDAYASALISMADDPHARACIGRANREKCRHRNTLEAMLRDYRDLYREALEAGRP